MTATPRSVIVVDDEPLVRRQVGEVLRRFGYAVREVASSEEARKAALDQPPDLLITDVLMPDVPGPDLAREICAAGRCKVLFVTGFAEEAETLLRLSGAEGGALEKPFGVQGLLTAVERLIGKP